MKRRALEDTVEFARNPEPRCPCILLLDTSQSMDGEKIEALNEGLRAFREDLASDTVAKRRVEVAVVTFDDYAHVRQTFITADGFHPPLLSASGKTHMAEGIDCAFNLLHARKELYRQNGVMYYRPWVFMITDGKPEGESDIAMDRAIERIKSAEEDKQAAFFTVAVEGADIPRLKRISVRKPLELNGFHFRELFIWLSGSMRCVSESSLSDQAVHLPPPTSWMKRVSKFITENQHVIEASSNVLKSIESIIKA